jgi:thiol-disulfide isomerase/thioredoxin
MRRKTTTFAVLSTIVELLCCLGLLALLSGQAHSAQPAPQKMMLVFGAEWCPTCKQMEPDVLALNKEGWAVYHVDVDKRPEDAKRMGVCDGAPIPMTIIATEKWERVAGVEGFQTRPQLLGLIKGWAIPRRAKK